MSLDKAVKHGKERRRDYRGSEAIAVSCRPHGGGSGRPCPWCQGNRLHRHRRRIDAAIATQDQPGDLDA